MIQPARDDVLANTLETAARESADLVAAALAEACRSLVKAATASHDAAEKARLADAAEALHRNVRAVADRVPGHLREEMAGAATARPVAAALSFDALELMAEDQVDDTVEIVRAQQALMSVVEPELVHLNALVSALQGNESVNAASNPLRPEVWVRTLHKAMGDATAAPSVRALWMNHTSSVLAPGLANLYRRVAHQLADQGVSAAAYRVAPSKHESRRAADASKLTLRDLKRLLVSASRPAGDVPETQPGQTLAGMTMPAAMEALAGMKRSDDVVKRMQERWRKGMWQPEAKTAAGGGGHYTPAQTLGREVVRLMVANAAADERLVPSMQDTVRALEPALLRLVLHDQRFFTDRRHPARELLEEITQRSLAWTREDAPGFAEFLAPLHEVVQTLSQMPFEDAGPFEYALQALRQSWAEAEERTRKQRASMARTLLKADARNHAAAEVAQQLQGRPDVSAAPPEVRRFLLGPWSHVIAGASLSAAPGAKDPGGHLAMVNDIVWSTQPRLASQNLARLEGIAASMIDHVRSGLAAIGYPQQQSRAILDQLAQAHAAARDPRTALPSAPSRTAADGAFEWVEESVPWLSPEEAGNSRLMQMADFEPTQEFAATQPATASARLEGAADLQQGQFVEALVRGAWARWRLSWASPHGSMLMFTDAGGRAESMTRQMYARMVEAGNIRPLRAQSVIEGALDAVARSALENSTQQPGDEPA